MPNRDSTSTNKHPSNSQSIISPGKKTVTGDVKGYLESKQIQARLVLINQAIFDYLQNVRGEPEVLYQAAHHLIIAGGKRLRSLLTLLSCEAVGGSIDRVLPFTVAAELLQTASLIHDDIIDKDEFRRGVPTVHKKFGHDIAILAGDFLIAQAFHLIGTHGSPELVANIGAGGVRMCEGEVFDLLISPSLEKEFTAKEYLKMIERKTAAFLEEAARNGAIIGEATHEQQSALASYGSLIGNAYQLKDDILDIQAKYQDIKKTTLSDLRLKRGNYPLLFALEQCSKDQSENCLHALDTNNWNVVLKFINQHEAIEHTMQLAQSYANLAKDAIQGFSFQNKDLLEQLAEFVVQREF
jgi:geranylgeranyl diphosphate synthase type I